MVNEPVKFDPGLTMKYGITPTVTLDLALNPDFAQVEADQTVITANQRFPIFYQEKRPFFLEGIDMFQLPLNVVHTRTIINPLVADKLVGKTGRNSYGLMFAADRGPGNYVGDERLDPFNFPLILSIRAVAPSRSVSRTISLATIGSYSGVISEPESTPESTRTPGPLGSR